ncbi:hypothetical protein ACIOFR_40960, partial [Kitasatospora sp. NPDC088346]
RRGSTTPPSAASPHHKPHSLTTVSLDLKSSAFATNIAIGVRAISGVNDVTLPDTHPVIEQLRKEFMAIPGDEL